MGLLKQFTGFWFGATACKSYTSIADRFVVSGSNFLTLVVVGRVCGLEGLGIFALAWTVLLTINVVQEAFVLSPFTVFFSQISDDKNQKTYAGAALAVQLMLAATALVLALITAILLTGLGTEPVIRDISWALLMAIPAASLREFARRYLFANLAAARVLKLDTVVAGLQFGGIGLFWYYDLLSPGSTLLVIALATGLPAIVWLILNNSCFKFVGKAFIATEIRRLWSYGRWICASQISDLAVTHGIAWLIAFMAGTAATGIYAACNSLVMVVNPLLLGIGSILLPRAAQANHRHGREEVNRIIWKTTAVLAVPVGILSLLVAWNGEYLIGVFYSLKMVDGIQEIVILLALANFIGATSFAIDNGLLVVNRPDVNFTASLVALVVTFLTAIALTAPFGLIGTVVGILIGTLFGAVFQIVSFVRLVGLPGALTLRRNDPENGT